MPAYTIEETIRRIAGIGYDGIEIGAAAPHAYPAHLSKERRKEIKEVLDDNGIAVSSMLPAPGEDLALTSLHLLRRSGERPLINTRR